MSARQTRAREEILNVAQPANPIVEQILALAGAIQSARDRYGFAWRKLKREIASAPVPFVCCSWTGVLLRLLFPLLLRLLDRCFWRCFLRKDLIEIDQPVVDSFESGIDVFDVWFSFDGLVTNHVHDDFGHAAWGTIARSLEDDVFHLAAAEMLYPLFAQNPGNRVGHVALTAAIWADDGGNSVSSKDYFGVVGEGFEASDFQALEFEHSLGHYKCEPLRMSTKT